MSKLTPPQSEVLFSNTIKSIENGLASQYHAVIEEDLESAEEYLVVCELEGDIEGVEEYYKEYAKKLGSALVAEAAIVFLFTHTATDSDASAIIIKKVNPVTGEEIENSAVFLGLVGGPSGNGHVHWTFNEDDEYIKFASDRIKEQEVVGLSFSL
jgi:hypothetical protein